MIDDAMSTVVRWRSAAPAADGATLARLDKNGLIEALRARVEDQLRTLRDSQRAAQEGAVHEEARQEDPKDTRAIEAQYIARGLAERVEDLHATRTRLAALRPVRFGEDDPVDVGALVGVSEDGDDGRERVYFVVPVAGGETVERDGVRIRTLTPTSPLGAALCGNRVDDEVVLDLPGRRLSTVIEWVE